MTADPQTLASGIEGIYEYAEARRGAAVIKPPEISGRFVLLRGSMILIATNRSDPTNVVDSAQFGSYTIANGVFSYQWEYRKGYTQSATESLVESKLTFDGQRRFSIENQNDSTRLLSEVPSQSEFRFFRDRFEYFENGALLRIWRKL